MDSTQTSDTAHPTALDSFARRKEALVDILYLLVSIWLYAISLIYPLAGIVLGIVFLTWARTPDGHRTGKICLILGIVNVAVVLLAMAIAVAVGGLMASVPFSHRWGGI